MSKKEDRRRIRVLLLEDNPEDVDLLRRALRSAALDCELIVMEEGAEALAFVGQQGKYAGIPVPDLAILDLNVPKHDGLEAMRMSRVFAGVPVAILSSSPSPESARKWTSSASHGSSQSRPPGTALGNRLDSEIPAG